MKRPPPRVYREKRSAYRLARDAPARETIARIKEEHATLGRHLENAIRTGIFCSYQPDRSPAWDLWAGAGRP